MKQLFDNLSWSLDYRRCHAVYRLTWGGKKYIGSSRNLNSRLYWWRTELRGLTSEVGVEVLSTFDNEVERLAEEARLVRLNVGGHNKTKDGKAGCPIGRVMSEASKIKISTANSGKKRSLEAKAKMRRAKLGRKRSPEHVAAIAESNRGKKRTEEQRAKISAACKGKPKSASHRAALSKAWQRRKLNSYENQRNIRQFAFGSPF